MDDLAERVRRLEEAQAFASHDVDALSQEVRRAYEIIETLRKRIDALERRADAAIQTDEDADDAQTA